MTPTDDRAHWRREARGLLQWAAGLCVILALAIYFRSTIGLAVGVAAWCLIASMLARR